MSDSFEQEPGLFGRVLQEVDRPGQVVRNLLRGELLSSGKHLVDLMTAPQRALFGSDIVPTLTEGDDYVSGAELVGVEDTPWYVKYPVGIGVDILTDPLSYLTFGTAGAAKNAVKAGAKATRMKKAIQTTMKGLGEAAEAGNKQAAANLGRLQKAIPKLDEAIKAGEEAANEVAKAPIGRFGIPFTKTGVDLPVTNRQMSEALGKATGLIPDTIKRPLGSVSKKAGEKIRSVFGNLDVGKEMESVLAISEGAGREAGKLGRTWLQNALKGVKEGSDMDQAISSVFDNIKYVDGVPDKLLEEGATLQAKVAAAANHHGVAEEALQKYVDEVIGYGKRQWSDMVAGGAVQGTGLDAPYLARSYKGLKHNEIGDVVDMIAGIPSSVRGRTLKTTDEVVDFLKSNPDITLESSAIKRLNQRILGQEGLIARGKFAKQVFGDDAVYREMREPMNKIIEHLTINDPDLAQVMKNVVGGKAPQGWFANVLAANNKIFKPAATFGILLPRFGFNVRNKLSSVWQQLSVPGGVPKQAAKTIPGDLYGAFADGLRRIGIGKGRKGNLAKQFTTLDKAYKAAKGSLEDFKAILQAKDPDLAKALEYGVLDGFVSTEDMIMAVGRGGKGELAKNILTWPAEITNGLESRMRLGSFLDLLPKHGAKKAAEITRDALLDYSMMKGGPGYANMRQLIPFLAFAAQSTGQQAKFLARNPVYAVALSSVVGQPDEPVEPWIADQPSMAIGKSREGNRLYATSLGLPTEVLNMLPGLGGPREFFGDVRKNLVGSANPLLKAAYGYTTGQDPFFGSKYGSYDKTPAMLRALGASPRSEMARVYNEAKQTGLIQPIASIEQQLSRAADSEMPLGARIANLMTGVRVYESDPDRAEYQILQQKLQQDPTARTYQTYYGGSDNTQKMIDALRDAKKRIKEKRRSQ